MKKGYQIFGQVVEKPNGGLINILHPMLEFGKPLYYRSVVSTAVCVDLAKKIVKEWSKFVVY